MRTPTIAGNWKMNKTIDEAVAFAKAFRPLAADVEGVEIGLAAPFPQLAPLAEALKGSNVGIGAQDVYWEASGAFTGEISPGMLLDAGCAFTLVGHSERRQFFGETNETVNRKCRAALAAGLSVIVCVGELLEEREAGRTNEVVKDHVANGLAGFSEAEMAKVTIAYEPVWAIGTGKTATPDQAQEVHAFIRGLLAEMFGKQAAEATRIQYGGSVKPANAAELLGQPDIDGALVGGASLEAESFIEIVRAGA
jgi:triosephosphate isomerase